MENLFDSVKQKKSFSLSLNIIKVIKKETFFILGSKYTTQYRIKAKKIITLV